MLGQAIMNNCHIHSGEHSTVIALVVGDQEESKYSCEHNDIACKCEIAGTNLNLEKENIQLNLNIIEYGRFVAKHKFGSYRRSACQNNGQSETANNKSHSQKNCQFQARVGAGHWILIETSLHDSWKYGKYIEKNYEERPPWTGGKILLIIESNLAALSKVVYWILTHMAEVHKPESLTSFQRSRLKPNRLICWMVIPKNNFHCNSWSNNLLSAWLEKELPWMIVDVILCSHIAVHCCQSRRMSQRTGAMKRKRKHGKMSIICKFFSEI